MSAQILPFTPRQKAAERRDGTDAAPAIIIFPGVRYERICGEGDEAPHQALAQHAAPRH